MSKNRILFVDDDNSVLAGIRSVLYRDRRRWDMVFALGGMAALAELCNGQFDIVVSDMRMPQVDGAAVLLTVKERSPGTLCVMLSGTEDAQTPNADEMLSKPCSADVLRGVLERLLASRPT
jgi:DNA-binding NtrC family response regulator